MYQLNMYASCTISIHGCKLSEHVLAYNHWMSVFGVNTGCWVPLVVSFWEFLGLFNTLRPRQLKGFQPMAVQLSNESCTAIGWNTGNCQVTCITNPKLSALHLTVDLFIQSKFSSDTIMGLYLMTFYYHLHISKLKKNSTEISFGSQCEI